MKKDLEQKEKGITLIALVITIIVLLILAAITLATLVGENGVLTKAEKAKVSQVHAQVSEAIKIEHNEYQIAKKTGEAGRQSTFLKFLIAKGYINEEGIVNTVNLLGNKVALGNGTGTSDVYKMEKKTSKYKLDYYDTESQITELLEIDSKDVLDWNQILAETTKPHPEQSEENQTIGIGTDGEVVNMDLWRYEEVENGFRLGIADFCGSVSPRLSRRNYRRKNTRNDTTIYKKNG